MHFYEDFQSSAHALQGVPSPLWIIFYFFANKVVCAKFALSSTVTVPTFSIASDCILSCFLIKTVFPGGKTLSVIWAEIYHLLWILAGSTMLERYKCLFGHQILTWTSRVCFSQHVIISIHLCSRLDVCFCVFAGCEQTTIVRVVILHQSD